jgi:hypothetical protein
MRLRFGFALVLLLGLLRTAAAQGPAGSTGAIASIPGYIVRAEPGYRMQPSIFASPPVASPSHQPPSEPVGRETKVRKR